jgi:hypothetical protein
LQWKTITHKDVALSTTRPRNLSKIPKIDTANIL